MNKRKYKPPPRIQKSGKRRLISFRSCLSGLFFITVIVLACALIISVYLFFPQRTNILLLGLDYTDPWNAVGRTDTIILSTFIMPDGYVGLISIPRDLWVSIPGVGENRINTAHYFSEARKPGTGINAAIDTIQHNFDIDIDYYIRIRFQGFRDVVDAMGGLDIKLTEPMAGYSAGDHHITGKKALAFARYRQGSDDFFRMERGQLLLNAMYEQMLSPVKWIRIPEILMAFSNAVDTNVPTWLWPRLIFTIFHGGIEGIDNRSILREMTTPYITDSGADILLPRWELINPLFYEIFGP
jgi:LCP family protein required for cell wall assembly